MDFFDLNPKRFYLDNTNKPNLLLYCINDKKFRRNDKNVFDYILLLLDCTILCDYFSTP